MAGGVIARAPAHDGFDAESIAVVRVGRAEPHSRSDELYWAVRRLLETLARETGARTAVLDPLEGLAPRAVEAGADYFTVMRANLSALRKGLGCP